jgi:hypothetical protein
MAKAKKKATAKEIGRKIGETIGSEIDKEMVKDDCCGKKTSAPPSGSGAVYGLGLIGAAVFYIQAATTFWGGVLGILKAIVWPAFLVYKLLGM